MTAPWRPPESFVHGVGGPVAIVPGRIAALLHDRFGLGRLRTEIRGQDAELDSVLVALGVAAGAWRTSVTGRKEAVQPEPVAASDQWVTTTSAAGLLGITDRAVRLAIQDQRLPAENHQGRWRITRADVEHYRAARHAKGQGS